MRRPRWVSGGVQLDGQIIDARKILAGDLGALVTYLAMYVGHLGEADPVAGGVECRSRGPWSASPADRQPLSPWAGWVGWCSVVAKAWCRIAANMSRVTARSAGRSRSGSRGVAVEPDQGVVVDDAADLES